VAKVELQNSFSKNTDPFRVFCPEALYRQRGGVRGGQGPPHHRATWARGAPPYGEVALWPPSGSRSVLVLLLIKIEVSAFYSSNSEDISYVAFLKHKIAENRKLALWHLVNRLVPKIA
jgi:hypothetical protein